MGYVFLKGNLNDRLTALRAHRLVRVLEVVDQTALARDLQQIHLSCCFLVLSGNPGR